MSASSSSWVSPYRADCLQGRVALVTGGGSGICFGIAKAFVEHGARVVIMGRRKQVLDAAVASLNAIRAHSAMAVQGDVREPEQAAAAVSQCVKSFGQLDVLVNGAAGNFLCSANDLSVNAFRTVLQIDLLGTFIVSKAAFDALRASAHGGLIINVSAIAKDMVHYQTHAAVAKAGIQQLLRNLANEWAPFRIRVVNIAPGAIADTEGFKRLSGGASAESVESAGLIGSSILLSRLGRTADIANAAIYACVADWVTGQTLTVDGGESVSRPAWVPKELYESIAAERRRAAKM